MPNNPPLRARIRFNPSEPQLVRLDWWEKAAASLGSGKSMHFCVGLWLMVALRRAPSVQLSRRMMARVNVSRYAASDALQSLETAGLVKVARLPGRSPLITLVEPGTSTPLRVDAASNR